MESVLRGVATVELTKEHMFATDLLNVDSVKKSSRGRANKKVTRKFMKRILCNLEKIFQYLLLDPDGEERYFKCFKKGNAKAFECV